MTSIPNGLCQCGCGKPTKLLLRNNATLGHIAGRFRKYALGHGNRKKPPTLEAIMERSAGVKGGCLEWQGPVMSAGYGYIILNRKVIGVHRVVYELTNGPIPKGLIIRHRCDNRLCCNPEHLDIGTTADNQRDKRERGRALQGEAHHSSKLTVESVLAIRASNETQSVLAARYKVTPEAVQRARVGVTWKSVLMPVKDALNN